MTTSARMHDRRSTLHDLPQYNRELEIQFYQYTNLFEPPHPFWWNIHLVINGFVHLIENTFWNSFICISVLVAVLLVTINVEHKWIRLGYNITYAIHMLAIAYNAYVNRHTHSISWKKVAGLLIDVLSFSHYVYTAEGYRFICYYIRLHRPFQYLWTLTNYNLKGSVLGTTLKYCYIFMVVRATWAIIWLIVDEIEQVYAEPGTRRSMKRIEEKSKWEMRSEWKDNSPTTFLFGLYIVNKMFIPIGPSVHPQNDSERVTCMLVMVSGCLVVFGAAVASMSLVISLYMRPEETFRARYRLIIKEMKETHVPQSQRDKVETFYKMFWHKLKAVSTTQLLPTFPPTLSATIQCDIYFEATQKSRILRELSYQFLTEVAKKMETKLFIPGDVIVKRSSSKSSVIYITYGDIEMVTAEDDATPILRMSRGTILTACGACTPAGLGPAHVEVRAATFCSAHVLEAKELWKVAVKYGKDTEQSSTMYDAFVTHMDKVQRHYRTKAHEAVKHKSSILHFKKCLVALKEARDANGHLLLERTDVFLEVAGCYIMRNRADSALTDESDAICLRPTFPCILQPASSLQMAWDIVVTGIIVTVCFVHPYYLVFKKTIPIDFRFFDYVVTGIYGIDIMVHLSTGANIEEGIPITFAQTAFQQMRSHWFVLDVFATLPIFEFFGNGHFAGINKLLRLHKVFRVLKSLEDICVYHSNVLRFLSYSLMLFIACYLLASLQQGFMCFHFGYCRVTNLTHSPYWEQKPLNEETVEHRVTFGLYWAISMVMFTTHMETWGTSNWYNVLYTMFVLELCVVLRIFMEAVYSATIMVTTSLREDYDATISMVKSFFVKNELDPVLQQRFITYLQLCWYTDKAYAMANKKSIFYDLPPHVYQDIVARQRVKYLLTIPFMKFLSNQDVKLVSSNARLFYTSPNEILINTGDISNEMYVISQGICEIINPETRAQAGLLHEKCHFGVFACLFRIPAHYTIRAVTHVQVFSVSLKSLSRPLEELYLRQVMEEIKTQPEYRTLSAPREPFIFYVPPDPIPNTEKFRLPRKHEMDFAFLQPFYRLGFLSVLRYIFPRFTIRPDGPYLIKYEWFRCACALASAMIYPGYTYLRIYWHSLHYVSWCLDLSAYLDMMQRMLIGYYTADGILVYHPASTAAHYAKGAFVVDLIACLPWENLQEPRKIGNRYYITRTEQFLMLGRLLQLYRLRSIMLVLDDYFERKDLIMVLRAIPLFIVMANVMTCMVIFYSTRIVYSDDYSSFEIQPDEDVGGSWLTLFSNQFRFNMTDSLWNLHLASYFWVLYETTTTGYNCFNPSNFNVMRLLFVGMLTGAMIITYFSVRIISLRSNVNKTLAEFQEHMKDIIIWMKKEKLDSELQRDVFDYYEYTWDKMGGVDYNSVFKLCDQITLRTDAILHVYGSTFSKCPILSSVEVSVLRMVGRASHSMHFLRGMTIVGFDDVISDLYFVDTGTIQARYTHEDVSVIDTLHIGSVFGNLQSEASVRCPVSFVTTNRVHLLRINSRTFRKIINEFPHILALIKKHIHNPPFYIKGGVTKQDNVKHPWKERILSAPITVRSRRNLIRFIYFKDNTVQTILILISLLCIYLDVYNVGFQQNSIAMIIALYVLDLAFCVKIALYLAMPWIGGHSQAKDILMHKRQQYLKGDFKYDVMSCLPVEVFCVVYPENVWMVFSWLRLNRLFRIVTVYSCLMRYREQITVNLGLVTIWAVTIWFTLSVHMISCMWYYIGMINERNQPGSSWIYKDDGTSWCDNTYICSLYFVVTTFTQNGVGDIMPKMQSEVVFVCILQIISTMVCMVYVGEFSNIIQYKSFRSFSFYSKYLELQEFLKNNRVSRNLVAQVSRYSLHLWRESRGFQSPHFLQTAPQALKLTVMSDAYMRHIRLHYIFQDCEPAFLRQLVGCLHHYTYDENMFVVKACEITNSMYFIHRGKVTDLSDDEDYKMTIYGVGTSFGLAQGLKHNVPFTESFKTVTKAQVLTLRLDDWLPLLKHFPESAAAIKSHDRDVGTGEDGPPDHRGHGGSEMHVRHSHPRITELMDRSTQPSPSGTETSDSSSTPPGSAGGHGGGAGHFVPPPGPSLPSLGPIDLPKDDRWPADSRRRTTSTFPSEKKPPTETELAETELAETELDATSPPAGTSRWPTDSRRVTLPTEKDATAETKLAETELDATSPPVGTSRWPTDSRRVTLPTEKDATAEIKLAETELDATSPPVGTSRWPTDSRRVTLPTEKDATAEIKLAEKILNAPSETKLTEKKPFVPLHVTEPSRRPIDSRQPDTSYSDKTDATAETKLTEKKPEAPSQVTEPSRRPIDSRQPDISYSAKTDPTAETKLTEKKPFVPSQVTEPSRRPINSRQPDTSYSAKTDATADTKLTDKKPEAPLQVTEPSRRPIDSRQPDTSYSAKTDATAETKLTDKKPEAPSQVTEPSRGPIDSRQPDTSYSAKTDATAETKLTDKKPEAPSQVTEPSRRPIVSHQPDTSYSAKTDATDETKLTDKKPEAPSQVTEPSRRPIDSRHPDTSYSAKTDATAETKLTEKKPEAPSQATEPSRRPIDSRQPDTSYSAKTDATAETKLTEKKSEAPSQATEPSRRPIDSRQPDTSYSAKTDPTAETKLTDKKPDASSQVTKTSRWPTDSRRDTFPTEKDATAETELAETKLDVASQDAVTSRWPTDSRRDTLPAEKDATEIELAETKLDVASQDAVTSRSPKDSRRDILPAEKDATAETELAETILDAPSVSAETSRWPTDSRRDTLPAEKDKTAETELAETKLDSSSSPSFANRWPIDSRRRDTNIRNLAYPPEEEDAETDDVDERKLGRALQARGNSSSASGYEAPPNTSSFDPSSYGSDASAKSKSSFLKRVAKAVKNLVPTRGDDDMRFSASEDSDRMRARRQSSMRRSETEEEYIARLEREFGRLSQTSNTSSFALTMPPELRQDVTQEAVDVATAPDDADLHALMEPSPRDKAIAAARLKRKSVRVRYEDDITDVREKTFGDSDESEQQRRATDEDPSNTSEKDSSSTSSDNKKNKN